MKDILMQQIELNEKYHDTKEKMAWTAATLYLGFSVAAINWILTVYGPVKGEWREFALLLFAIWTVFLAGLMFVRFQFLMRWNSVRKSAELKAVLQKCRAGHGPQGYVIERCKAEAYYAKDPRHKRHGFRTLWLTISFLLIVGIVFIIRSGSQDALNGKLKWPKVFRLWWTFLDCKKNDVGLRKSKNRWMGRRDSRYKTEIPTYALMTYLMFAQVALLVIHYWSALCASPFLRIANA